jgi:hypothetical protein
MLSKLDARHPLHHRLLELLSSAQARSPLKMSAEEAVKSSHVPGGSHGEWSWGVVAAMKGEDHRCGGWEWEKIVAKGKV